MHDAALDELTADLRGFIDRIPVGVFRTTPDGRVVMGNRALAELLGAPDVAALLEVDVRSFYVNPTKRDEVFLAHDLEGPIQEDLELVRLDGRRIWVRSTSRPILGEDGSVVLLEGVLQDVTERYETRARLARSEQRFRTAFENAPIGMIITAPDRSSATANPAFLRIVGLADGATTEELLATVSADDVPDLERRFAALRSGEIDGYTTLRKLQRPDGTIVWARLHVSALRDEHGRLTSILTQAVDETATRRTQAELRQLADSKDDLVRAVSHELRTPLTTIVGLAAELADRHDDFTDGERRELTRLMATQAEEMADLVDDLLAAARSEVGPLQIDLVDVDLVGELGAVVAGWRGSAPSFHTEVAEAWARIDPFRLRQIVRNLLSNADKYGSEPVEVRLARSTGDGWDLQVVDAGPGLPESEWESIFDRYHRAADAPGAPGSLGLGLSLARQLAQRMGGDLSYRAEDGRSVFTLSLPAVA